MPEATILQGQEPGALGVRHIFEVQFGFTGTPPAGTGDIPDDGTPITGSFSKISGLREEVERVSWRDGTEPMRVVHGPGTISGGIVTFEKGVVRRPLTLLRWFTAIRFLSKAMQNRSVRNNATKPDVRDAIAPILIDGMAGFSLIADEPQIPAGDEFGMYAGLNILIGTCEKDPLEGGDDFTDEAAFAIRRIGLFRCWPVAYQISDLDAKASEVAVESLSVSFDELRTGRALV